jgi:hypothetical protein
MPKLSLAAREKHIPGWRKFLAQMWDEGLLYVDIASCLPEPHAVQQMIMNYGGPDCVANMVAFDAHYEPRLADLMALSSDELEKKYSQIGLARRTETDREPKVTTLAFVKETWNRNSWRIQQGRNYRKKPQIFDQIAGTRPPTYDDFLVGAASMTGISSAPAPASASALPPPPPPATTVPLMTSKKRKVQALAPAAAAADEAADEFVDSLWACGGGDTAGLKSYHEWCQGGLYEEGV